MIPYLLIFFVALGCATFEQDDDEGYYVFPARFSTDASVIFSDGNEQRNLKVLMARNAEDMIVDVFDHDTVKELFRVNISEFAVKWHFHEGLFKNSQPYEPALRAVVAFMNAEHLIRNDMVTFNHQSGNTTFTGSKFETVLSQSNKDSCTLPKSIDVVTSRPVHGQYYLTFNLLNLECP